MRPLGAEGGGWGREAAIFVFAFLSGRGKTARFWAGTFSLKKYT